ncbi:putative low complexity [Cryptosporidium xiaoi]|uniref:Low complexity n=1 Tax=Cryptosporidium xiaoi TaxID=659607 RepID=A0AAV9Y0T2_9CRYT
MIDQRFEKKNSNFKSIKLLNRPLKATGLRVDSEQNNNTDSKVSNKQFNPIKGLLKPRRKEHNSLFQNVKVKPHPSEIGTFKNQNNTNIVRTTFDQSELPSSSSSINNETKTLGFLDITTKSGESTYFDAHVTAPIIQMESNNVHQNLDRLKNEFCRFIDFKYHASTIGNTDLEQRIFLRNCFEKLKEVDYPTIKQQQWNEYQNLLLEQKKNLLLFQKSRSGDQPLDDAWCQTDAYSFDEYVNNNIKLKFDKLKEIKMKRLALKKKLFLKGYFDITDFDDIEEIYDDKMLTKLGLGNQFINDSSEDELDDLMNYVDQIDSEGRITYNNYQIKQILGVFDRKLRRRCKPDYYQFFFGRTDYEKEIDDKRRRLNDLNGSERVPMELKMKLVEFLDKKLNWTEIETPWEWEHDFVVDEMNNSNKRKSNIKLSDLDCTLLKGSIPGDFLYELTEIRKNYRRELLDNELRIYEMRGISDELTRGFNKNGELLKMELYNNEMNKDFNKLCETIVDENSETGELAQINGDKQLVEHRVRFKEPEILSIKDKNNEPYNIVVEREDQSPQISHLNIDDSVEVKTDFEMTPKIEIDQKKISIYLNRDMLNKGVAERIKEDLSAHLSKIISEQQTRFEAKNISNTVQNHISNDYSEVGKNFPLLIDFNDKVNNLNLAKLQVDKCEKLDSHTNSIYNAINLDVGLLQSNRDIESIKSRLSLLRNAAGVLEVLKEHEQESNIIYNHRKLKDLITERVGNSDFNLDQGEIKTLQDGVDEIIKGIIERRKVIKTEG